MSVRGLDAFFAPQGVLVLGRPVNAGQRRLLKNLEGSVPEARRALTGGAIPAWRTESAREPLEHPDLAVALDAASLDAGLVQALAKRGCHALIAAMDSELDATFLEAADKAGIRVLGARSAGVVRPAGGVNACAFDQAVVPGSIAFITQSRTIAAAALDWALGIGRGLAWLASTGAEADVDIPDLLDYAALDGDVTGIVLQLGRVRDGRRFMSAARAAARTKPVVVLQTHGWGEMLFPASGHDPVRSAAFARAGLIECTSLGGLFDAMAALDEPPRGALRDVAVVGNGAGVAALGVNALLQDRIPLGSLAEEVREQLRGRWPQVRFPAGAIDVGSAPPSAIVALAEYLLAQPTIGTVLLLHSPEAGTSHLDIAQEIAASTNAAHIPSVWLGLESARSARRFCIANGLTTYTSPEQAARALRYPRQYLWTREALTQTPPLWQRFTPDPRRVASALADARSEGRPARRAAARLLEAFGVGRRYGFPGELAVRVRVFHHREFGSCLALRADATAMRGGEVYGLPPLDAVLARRMLEAAGFDWNAGDTAARRNLQRLAIALLRVASLVIDQPRVGHLSARLAVTPYSGHCCITEASLWLDEDPPAERQRLVLAPYPSALTQRVTLRSGLCCTVRAVRPEDEPQIIAMLENTDPEAIRLRFFGAIRTFTHAMAARFSQIDYDRELVLVATECADDAQAIVALGHLSIDDEEPLRAEYAILVHQDYARQGLGRDVLERLLAYAGTRGVEVVYGEILGENLGMQALCRSLGFSIRMDPDDPHCVLSEYRVPAASPV
ncbi:MAG TPA: GNAT family N-acetyltransferase [Nevskiaceae bacterium]